MISICSEYCWRILCRSGATSRDPGGERAVRRTHAAMLGYRTARLRDERALLGPLAMSAPAALWLEGNACVEYCVSARTAHGGVGRLARVIETTMRSAMFASKGSIVIGTGRSSFHSTAGRCEPVNPPIGGSSSGVADQGKAVLEPAAGSRKENICYPCRSTILLLEPFLAAFVHELREDLSSCRRSKGEKE
jgi:hypothetical protein